MPTPTPVQRMLVPNDENTRLYFSRTELSEKVSTAVARGDVSEGPIEPVIEYALQIPGVAVAAVSPYNMMIVKAPTFSWEEVEPCVMNLLLSLNSGEGKLFQEEGGTATEPTLPAPEDLGHGYTLVFQRKPESDQVRAVVKATDGSIIARGSVVSQAAASVSRLQAIDELEHNAPPCT